MHIGPKRRWHLYLFSLIPFIAGLAICTLLGMRVWNGLAAFDRSLVRIVVPGEGVVSLAVAGDYTIFHEYRSIVDDAVYSSPEDSISGMKCALTHEATGEEIRLRPSTSKSTYSFGSREGTSLFGFRLKEPGEYRLICGYPADGYDGPSTVLAIGHGFGEEIFQTIFFIFGIILIFIISFGTSAGLIVYIVIKKSHHGQETA